MFQNLDLKHIGKKFGKLKIIEFSHKDTKQRAFHWKCICDCGNIVTVRYSSLKSGNTTSCGCLQKRLASSIITHENRKRILPTGLAAQRNLFRCYRKDAKKRQLEFKLTFDDFITITSKSCNYCNIKPNQIHKNENWNGSYQYNGIDRLNNNKGYTIENSVPCCRWCNIGKGNRSLSEFLVWIDRVYKHSII